MLNETVKAGIHPIARSKIDALFSKKGKEIARYWGNEWYVTSADSIEIGQSSYRYFLIKPTSTHKSINVEISNL